MQKNVRRGVYQKEENRDNAGNSADLGLFFFDILYIWLWGDNILKKIFKLQDETALSFPIFVFLGIAVLTTLASFQSLLMPLGGEATILIFLGGVLIAILTRPWEYLSRPTYPPMVLILLVIVTMAIAGNAIYRPSNYDTALYHAQAIHWIESYRVVPGLVNIDDRLAYNSSWLVLVASLSFAFLGFRSFHLTNSVILIASMIYFGEGFQGLIQKQVTISNIVKVVLFFLPLYLYASDLSSPGTDLPPTLLTWVITVLTLEKIEKQGWNFDLYSITIVILSVFSLTIKLSALPLCGLAFLILFWQIWNKDWQRSATLIATSFLILLPWLLRNIVLSGYLIYPISQIDLFSFDWKHSLSDTRDAQEGLLWFNRFPFTGEKYIGMSALQWVPLWFHLLDRGQKIFLLAALASPIGLFVFIFNRISPKIITGCMIAFLINYIGIYFWFLTVPIFRFGYAYLLASLILASTPAILKLTGLIKNGWTMISLPLTIFAILFQFYILTTTVNLSILSQHAFLPADYSASNVDPCPIDNVTFYCHTKFGQCNYEAFPCLPKPRSNVEMRGASLQDGFRIIQKP